MLERPRTLGRGPRAAPTCAQQLRERGAAADAEAAIWPLAGAGGEAPETPLWEGRPIDQWLRERA
eukprot:10388189-Alexandrium_andersonii.AAC.1